ncbi:MAG: hypothetical protein ACE369_18365 [Roseovarius sp.]
MTTYTLQGYFITDQNNTTTAVSPVTLALTVPEGTNSFTYSVIPPAPQTGDFPEVDIQAALYNFTLNGSTFTTETADSVDFFLGQIEWSGGTTYAITADLPGGAENTQHVFFIGGATPPPLNTPQQVDSFIGSFTAPPAQAEGAFAPGSTISLTNIPGVVISEDDEILGTPGDDVLVGGLGDDFINPGTNDGYDQILPGVGNDTIDFGDSAFPSYYELNYGDLTNPVAVNVNLAMNTGSVNAGAEGTDTFLDISRGTAYTTSDGTALLLGDTDDTVNITTASDHWFGVAPGAGNDDLNLNIAADSIVRVDLNSSGDGGPTQAANVNIGAGVIANDGFGDSDTISVTGSGMLEVRLTAFDDTYVGHDGMDRVVSRGGDDTLDGMGGVDLLRYDRSGVGPVAVNLEDGTATGTWNGVAFEQVVMNFEAVRGSRNGGDLLIGDENDNILDGRGGDDTLFGNGGIDTLIGGDGNDTFVIDGMDATGEVTIIDDDGMNTVQFLEYPGPDGGSFFVDGSDLVAVSNSGQTTRIVGGTGTVQQVQLVSPGGTIIYATTDLITDMNDATSASYTFAGTQGNDMVTAAAVAGSGSAFVFLNDGDDTFFAASGYTARVHLGMGEDVFVGGSADDWVRGQEGNDSLEGGAGNDTLAGEDGDDTMNGGDGDDFIHAIGAGADSIDGGAGTDHLSYQGASGRVLVDLQSDVSGAGFARFFTEGAGSGDTFTSIENVTGCNFADNLRGNGLDNELNGGKLSDRLYGRGGDDTLDGGTGADALYGNAGADTMTGGPDEGRTDRFIYFNAVETGVGAGNRDIITDFVSGEDRIELRRIDADISQGFKQFFDFVGDAAFSNTAGELRYEQVGGNTIVQADRDGDGVADMEIELTGTINLVEDDFFI